LIVLRKIDKTYDLTQKIVITDNLNIDFITNLTYKNKPAGIILTHGSLTAHAVTIIREARIPSVLAYDLEFIGKKFAKISKNGEVNLK